MKRLISILVVLSSVFLSVVFAEGAFAITDVGEGGPGADGTAPDFTEPTPEWNPEDVEGVVSGDDYLKCLRDKTQTWDVKKNECVKGDDYCAGLGGELKWNPNSGACFDPNSEQGTVLPDTKLSETECEVVFNADAQKINLLKDFLSGKDPENGDLSIPNSDLKVSKLSVLGCAIKTGRVRIWMIPYFIKYFIQFALIIAGIVAVGAMVFGGYLYLFGALIDDKEKGKRAIIYGLGGFVLSLLSWALVNIVIALATR